MKGNAEHAAVEVREDYPGEVLDALAGELLIRGYQVSRWAHEYNPLAPPITQCDLAVVWNGLSLAYWPIKAKLREWGCRTLFCEVGWTDRSKFQIDPAGVNAYASWAATPLASAMDATAEPGDVLVLLDDERHLHEAQLSPWVGGLEKFCRLVCEHSRVPVRVRMNPDRRDDPVLAAIVESYPNCRMENRDALADCWDGVGAVAAIATSAAIQGIQRGLPVICYGRAVYALWPVAYVSSGEPWATQQATEYLSLGILPVSRSGQAEFLARIESHQHSIADIPGLDL